MCTRFTNVLFTVQLPLVKSMMLDIAGWTQTRWDPVERRLALDVPGVEDGDSTAQQRSITNALTFYREGGWGRMCTLLDTELRNHMWRHKGADVQLRQLLRAMFANIAKMVAVANTPVAQPQQVADVARAAGTLREIMHSLRAKGTPWTHV